MTAQRWARILRELGHRVSVDHDYRRQPCDLLIALHARRSAASVERFSELRPEAPILLALTGTDLYRDFDDSVTAQRTLELASLLVVLQPLATAKLPSGERPKVRVIYQSAQPYGGRVFPRRGVFEVAVLAHLREVKDPLRPALAARLLPPGSRIEVVHMGGTLEPELERRAREMVARNPRYRWLGERPHWQALRLLARARMLVVPSLMEGGANVVSEALANSVPVLASRIPGSIGLLGEDYPGYFDVGDESALARLMERAENDASFYGELRERCRRLGSMVEPVAEREAWAALLAELAGQGLRATSRA